MLMNMLRVFACGSIACAVSNWWSITESFGISEARQNEEDFGNLFQWIEV